MAGLSSRAHAASLPHPSTVLWDVLHNLYDPQTNPSGFISLGVAENALMHAELATYCDNISSKSPLPTSALTYGDGPTGSKRCKLSVSHFLTRGLKPVTPIRPDHLLLTSGVTAAIEHCSWALCNPGEAFLLGQPHYGSFIGDISTRPNVHVVRVSFGEKDPIGPDCVRAYEDALLLSEKQGVKVKALMLCNPHNPLGRCYSRPTLLAVMALCARHSLHLVSDEIYAFSTWANTTLSPGDPEPDPFTSVLSISPKEEIDLPPSHLHVLYGLSKDFGANGLRLGCIVSQSNPALLSAIRSVALHSSPSSLADHVAATLLADEAFTDEYIRTNQARLAEANAYVTAWARRYGIPYARGANAAFFLWCDFGAVWHRDQSQSQSQSQDASSDCKPNSKTLTAQIMDELMSRKIFLANGESFGSEKQGWFRIVFSQPRPYLDEGLRRIVTALGLEKEADGKKKSLLTRALL